MSDSTSHHSPVASLKKLVHIQRDVHFAMLRTLMHIFRESMNTVERDGLANASQKLIHILRVNFAMIVQKLMHIFRKLMNVVEKDGLANAFQKFTRILQRKRLDLAMTSFGYLLLYIMYRWFVRSRLTSPSMKANGTLDSMSTDSTDVTDIGELSSSGSFSLSPNLSDVDVTVTSHPTKHKDPEGNECPEPYANLLARAHFIAKQGPNQVAAHYGEFRNAMDHLVTIDYFYIHKLLAQKALASPLAHMPGTKWSKKDTAFKNLPGEEEALDALVRERIRSIDTHVMSICE